MALEMQEKVQAVYFSPTGTTRRILSAIFENVGLKATPPMDLTLPSQRNSFTGKVGGDLTLVGSPVYAGTIPLPFFESLQKISGEGKWAVPVAVYGNRSPDTAVEELNKILRGRGFKVLASASFIGQHSFATPEHPWGIGRPDEADLMTAAEFGKAVGEKFKHSPAEISMPGLLLERFSDTMVDELPEGYHSKVLAAVRTLGRISLDKAGCTQCNSCVDSCPVAAIDAESFGIDDSKCIFCAACVRNCPTGTMRIVYSDSPRASATFANLDKVNAIRKEPKTIL
ncbi:MAG: 4Fe-4S binding protein [Candidatus Bathyarchaeia archaeon]|jgi:ferredoxin